MYHPDTIAARETALLSHPALRSVYPDGLPRYSVADTATFTRQLADARDAAGRPLRRLTVDEERFLAATQLLVGIDFPYFAARFSFIDDAGHGLRPLYPLWESQTFVLDQLARLERARWTGHPDGLLVSTLKARQLGISTLAETLVAHRVLFTPHTRALSGADVEDQAGYLFRMVARLYEHLPWFLKPARLTFVKNREATYDNGGAHKTAWGKSTRGALQSVTGQEGTKGAIGRGQTYGAVHISELATWDNPSQLDTALLPAIPIHPDTLVVFESTAEHAGDWWHQHWLAGEAGLGRFLNVFIPWGVEPSKYALPAPVGWSPSAATLAHAVKAEAELRRWLGAPRTLTRDQLYWYETTRALYQQKGNLAGFLKEYPADPYECFQYAGRSVFTLEELDAIDAAGSRVPLVDVWSVEPARDIAELRRLPDDADDAPGARVLDRLVAADRRPPPPLAPRLSTASSALAHEAFPVPPGYGFQRLSPSALAALPSLRAGVLAIWEYPRTRGRRRYILAADVAEGLGLDASVASIVRQPTIEEPAMLVAQYISHTIDTQQFAFVCDALGRLYPDEDGVEALAAIETEGPGLAVQDTLQLHLGYSHFYVWEVADAASPQRRFTTRIGWATTSRTRPILLHSFRDAITTIDPVSGLPDFLLPSPATRAELRHFITPTGHLSDAEHAHGQHDDCLFSAAIGYYVAWRHAGGETEPIAEKRRRRAAQQQLRARDQAAGPRVDWRNSAVTAEEADQQLEADDEFLDDLGQAARLHFDERSYE